MVSFSTTTKTPKIAPPAPLIPSARSPMRASPRPSTGTKWPIVNPPISPSSPVPDRYAKLGDPHQNIDRSPGSLETLLELAAADEAAGLGDAPWPPHFRKMEGEVPRVAPSRAKSPAKPKREKAPLLVIANSPNKQAALEGLERWQAKHAKVVEHLLPEDILVDSMRGHSSTWTRIRINLKNVPELLRPAPEPPDPDDDPTRSWREHSAAKRAAKKASSVD